MAILLMTSLWADDFQKGMNLYNKKDYASAVKSFKKACDSRNMTGCYNLGYMYEAGEGVIKNLETALVYYKKAAKLGDKDAKQKVVEIEDSIETDKFLYSKGNYNYVCNANIMDKLFKEKNLIVQGDGPGIVMVFDENTIKFDNQMDSANVWVTYFDTNEATPINNNVTSVRGYQKVLKTYFFKSNEAETIHNVDYSCDGNTLSTIPEQKGKYPIVPGSLDEVAYKHLKDAKYIYDVTHSNK